MPSIVGWCCRLPWQGFVAGSVAPEDCHLALVAARAPRAVCGEDGQSDSMLATTPGGRAGVGIAEKWPRFGEPALPLHGEPSDSPVR